MASIQQVSKLKQVSKLMASIQSKYPKQVSKLMASIQTNGKYPNCNSVKAFIIIPFLWKAQGEQEH